MAIIRLTERPGFMNPWAEFERIRQGLDQLSQSMAGGDVLHGRATVFPPVNVYEDKEHIIIKAEIPGVTYEDLDISIEGETLSIQGVREKHEDEKISFHRREIERGSFSRAITLPTKIDPDNVFARLKNGILTITIGKAAEVKPRQITVSTE
jgi:HSP20 family protein